MKEYDGVRVIMHTYCIFFKMVDKPIKKKGSLQTIKIYWIMQLFFFLQQTGLVFLTLFCPSLK